MRQYPNPAAFRAAIDTRLRSHARTAGIPVQVVRRQAALERLMARLARVAPGRWALKGGLAMDTRLPEHARASMDMDIDHMLGAAAAREDLEKLARAPADRLSGGEAQRVALARALAVQPKVLLLDEPSANLDPYSMGLVEGMIQSLRAERRTTQVVVTHNVFQARRLADRVAMLLRGRIIEVAEADRFFEQPSDPRSAAFLRGELVF